MHNDRYPGGYAALGGGDWGLGTVAETRMTMKDLPERLRALADALEALEWDVPLLSREACLEAAKVLERMEAKGESAGLTEG